MVKSIENKQFGGMDTILISKSLVYSGVVSFESSSANL